MFKGDSIMPDNYNEQNSLNELSASAESSVSQTAAEPRKSKRRIIVPIVILAVAAVVAAVVFCFFSSKKTGSEPRVLFIKDESFFASEAKDFSVNYFVADYDDSEDDDKFGFLNSVVTLGYSEVFGDIIYYCSDFEDGKCNIYRKDITDTEPAEKIESDVSLTFAAKQDGSALVYVKSKNLFINNLDGTKTKIDTDVISWCINDDFTAVLYASEEDEGTFALYQATLGEKPSPQKIVSGISEVVNISDDLSTIYYIKNNNLYRNVNGKEGKKLVADVESVYFSDSETFYFTKSNENKILKSDYFDDDYREGDLQITEPRESDYQYYFYGYYFTDEEYYEALEDYRIKKNRDQVRENAKEPVDSKSLYFYNGSEEIHVCDDIFEFTVNENGHAVFTAYDSSKIEKFKMSDLEYISDFEPFFANARKSTLVTHYSHNGKIIDVGYDKPTGFYVDGVNDKMYFISDTKTDKNKVDFGMLSCVSFDENGDETVNELYADVYSVSFITDAGVPVYFKNVDKNGCGDLYEGETKIASGVKTDSVKHIDGKYYILKDYDIETYTGTLSFGTSGSFADVAEEVYDFEVNGSDIVYSTNYDKRSDTFDLYWYNGTESKEIKKEVSEYTVCVESLINKASKTEVFNYYSCLSVYHEKLWEDSLVDSETDNVFDGERQDGLQGGTNAA